MSIKVITCTRNMKQPVWVASYIPEKREPIWFGWVKRHKKNGVYTGKISYMPGRKPDRQGRSGYTPESALNRLHGYLDSAFAAYIVVYPNAEERTREGR